MKIGDKLYCKKNFFWNPYLSETESKTSFTKGKHYKIVSINTITFNTTIVLKSNYNDRYYFTENMINEYFRDEGTMEPTKNISPHTL